MNIALFDFDGTITTRDSFKDFILFTHGPLRTLIGAIVLSPVLILFGLKLLSNSRTKEFVVTYFYRGWSKDKLGEVAARYAQERLGLIVKKSAMERILWHKSQGHRIVVVSASPEFYLTEWCRMQGLELIATRIAYQNEHVTGKLEGKNCHGEEKVVRLKEKFDLGQFEYIYAYGDSPGDRPLERISNEFHYRSFT